MSKEKFYKQHYVICGQNSSGISNGSSFYVEWKVKKTRVYHPHIYNDCLSSDEAAVRNNSQKSLQITALPLSSKEFKHMKKGSTATPSKIFTTWPHFNNS